MDTGDFVIVTNVEKIRVTGNKAPSEDVFPSLRSFPGGIANQFRKAASQIAGPRPQNAVKACCQKGPPGLRDAQKAQSAHAGDATHAPQQPKTVYVRTSKRLAQGIIKMIGNFHYGTGRRKSAVAPCSSNLAARRVHGERQTG